VSRRHVVVTGMGCVTPLGGDLPTTWRNLLDGKCARGPIRVIDVEGCRVTEGAEAIVPDDPGFAGKEATRSSRATRLAVPAAREALRDAGLLGEDGRCAVPQLESVISTTACGMELGEGFLKTVRASSTRGQTARVARHPAHRQVDDIQRHLGFRGRSTIVANACASGANAVGHAADLIKAGFADIVLAGGFEALCELVFCGFDCLQALDPERCRPFDANRRGLMLGEGAAFLVLESSGHAEARGAEPRAVVAGYGHTTDPHHITQPDPGGAPLAEALRRALAKAGSGPSDVAHLNAHGTGTPFNDAAEAAAFTGMFTEATRIVSTKAAIGHTLGAAGAIESVFAVMTLATRLQPPQILCSEPMPGMGHLLVRPGEKAGRGLVASVNLGFGGSNAALVFDHP
jgi:3-oxoacyl-[acyl-carrier-protein] synthase II